MEQTVQHSSRKTIATRCVVMGLAFALLALALACGIYLYYSPGRGAPAVDKDGQSRLVVPMQISAT